MPPPVGIEFPAPSGGIIGIALIARPTLCPQRGPLSRPKVGQVRLKFFTTTSAFFKHSPLYNAARLIDTVCLIFIFKGL